MFLRKTAISFLLICCLHPVVFGQRTYKPQSVLASGVWYKIAVTSPGIYKIDLPFLQSLGIGGPVSSAQVRLFGTTGGMLPEDNASARIDDLQEVAILLEDGGDGQLNGSDYISFYTPGPNHWVKDSALKEFRHVKNLYSDQSYYFLTIGGTGRRITAQTDVPPAAATVTSFSERYFHELDTLNFLASGKEWFGEELSALPGRSLGRSFSLPLSDLVQGSLANIRTSVAARSVNAGSGFTVTFNNQPVQNISVGAISAGQYDLFARQAEAHNPFTISGSGNTLSLNYTPGSFNSQGWINWFELNARRSLNLSNNQLQFRDWNSVQSGAAEFVLTNVTAGTSVWDVTDVFNPVVMSSTITAGQLRFRNETNRLREYVAFNGFLSPTAVGRVNNQNLHNTAEADYFIITVPQFRTEAQRLADFHSAKNQLRPVIVTTEEIFNEFSGGIPDPTAIRDFIKMYYDRFRSTWNQKGKYLLLFGKGSFDYKNRIANNTNLVPVYESLSSVDPLSTYTSDDFFGFLDDNEDINSNIIINTVDLGIGRVPAKTVSEAKQFVDKLLDYHAPAAFGPWRNQLNFIADDEDQNLHLQDAELLTTTVAGTAPVFNRDKIYLDAFQQESGSAGGRYPGVNAAINSNIYNGTLIWNYTGHGGPQRLAEEVILDAAVVASWNNAFRLPLFITATCDFTTYDNPLVNSLGENLILRPKTGAIALMTTSRVVFAFSNRIMNDNYLKTALQKKPNGSYPSLGEAVMASKNLTYNTSGDVVNNRKFALVGDPAMTLAFPQLQAVATRINGKDVSQPDTLSATDFVTIEGEVRDQAGLLQSNFSGTAYLSLFDKPRNVTTLANDASSQAVTFTEQNSILFKGKASANAGRFLFRFRMPKDINYQFGVGKISLYAHNQTTDANSFSNNIIVGGISGTANADKEGPEIKAWLNDERFVNGSITNAAPVLILKLSDSSGINTGSSGIDHDIVATLDNNNNQYFILNNFYETDLDSYQQGVVRFQLPSLSPGQHSLRIKAWDVVNNSSEYELNFTVVNEEELRIDHVLNYPNPFTTNTSFWFEHNYPGIDLFAKVDVFTVSGKRIKTLTSTINTTGNRSMELTWDGRDEWGEKLARGVYLYRLYVKAANGKTASHWQKLVVL